MASNKTSLASKNVKNPLFSTGIANFPVEEFTQGVLLVPPPKESEQLLTKGLGGEVDTFLGQNVTDISSCPLPSSENINSDQSPTLIPPPPSLVTSNFRSLPPSRPSIGRPLESVHPLAESQIDSEPDFKQIPLDDSVPLYNVGAVLKSSNRENSQEHNYIPNKFEGGVPLYDPSDVGSVLPPHATKRPLPNRSDNIVGPTPASLDPAYSSLSKHISTCSPALVIDSGPPLTNVPFTANTSESRKSSSSSSVHELNAFNLHDHRPQPPLSYSASSPSLHSLPLKAPPTLPLSHQSASLHSSLISHGHPISSVPLYAAQANQIPLYPVPNRDLPEKNLIGHVELDTASATSSSGFLLNSSNKTPVGSSGVAPINPSQPNPVYSLADHSNKFLLNQSSSDVNTPNLVDSPVRNEVKSNEASANLSFTSSISDYSLPSFLNPLNFFKKGASPSSQSGPALDNPVHAAPFSDAHLINAQASGSIHSSLLNDDVSPVVASPVIPQASEPSPITQNPLPPPPLTGFQASSTPLSSLPKIHHSFSANPYSLHSQKKVATSSFKPEHYFTPIPISEASQGSSEESVQTVEAAANLSINLVNRDSFKSDNIHSWSDPHNQKQQVNKVFEESNLTEPLPPVSAAFQHQTCPVDANFINTTFPPLCEGTSANGPSIVKDTVAIGNSLPSQPAVSSAILANAPTLSRNENLNYHQLPSFQPIGFQGSDLSPHQSLNQVQPPVAFPPTQNSVGPPPIGPKANNYRLGSLRKQPYAPVPDFGVSPIARPVIMDNQDSTATNSSSQGLYQPPLQPINPPLHLPPDQSTASLNLQSYSCPTDNDQKTTSSDPISSAIHKPLPELSPLTSSTSHSKNLNNFYSDISSSDMSFQVNPQTEKEFSSALSVTSTESFGVPHYNSNFPSIPSSSVSSQQQSYASSAVPVRPPFINEVNSQPDQIDSIVNVIDASSSTPSEQCQSRASMPVIGMQTVNFFETSSGFKPNQARLSPKSISYSTSSIQPPSYSNPLPENNVSPNDLAGNLAQTSTGNQQGLHQSSNSPAANPAKPDGGSSPPFLTSHSSVQQPYTSLTVSQTYRPVYHHWFFRKGDDKKNQWQPFSMADSLNLEQQFTSDSRTESSKVVATDGGRYDVNVETRKRVAVYWHEKEGEVRRCSWFVKGPVDSKYQPYDENIAALLEEEYRTACIRNEWNRKVELSDGEVIIIHSPNAIAHHQRSSSPDPWGSPPPIAEKHRVVKRGLDEFDIPEGEPTQVDHLILLVHGIGKVCDLRFRSLIEVVDDFRNVSINLVASHFKTAVERGKVGRVEVLPVEWHRALHTETIDQRLNNITLPSIPKARQFTNETLLDILFYTSPVFCEKIVEAVGAEVNRVYSLYLRRNPGFKGGVSLGGHSLGSLILFDMLCHQKPPHPEMLSKPSVSFDEGDEDVYSLGCLKTRARLSRRMSYLTIGNSGAGQPFIAYPQFNFQPRSFFALGSPIGMFITVRGIESLGPEFKFPTCPSFFNIFHPNDPVAYRIEGLINPELAHYPAVLIPHHKGRKRMHLELKETMSYLTTAVKQKLLDSVKNTWNTVSSFTRFRLDHSALENQVDKVIDDEILCKDRSDDSSSVSDSVEQDNAELKVGELNGGRRIDYVLQEAPLETFNQYISAVRSHLVYWESEDTMLLMLKEVYGAKGITADCQVPQPILPFDLTPEANADPGTAYSHYTVSPSPSPSRQQTIMEEPL